MTVYRHRGLWRYDFLKHGVRHRKSGYPTKESARIAEAQARKNLRGTNTDFIGLCESRLKELETRRTGKWFKENKLLIEKLILLWAKKKEITRQDVEGVINQTAQTSHTNANAQLKMIKALFNHGIERDWLVINPAAKIKKFPVAKARKYIPEQDDIKKVIRVAGPIDRLYLLVIAHTLGRITAVNRLRWEDITPSHITLYTRKARNSDLKAITIPMNRVLSETIKQIPREGEYLFINPKTGKPYDYRKRLLRTLCKKAEVRYFSYHALRHFGASKLDHAGVPLTDIQAILGHERATTTDIYLQSLRGSTKKALKELEDLE
ncbi:MAG: tyrosine-type recombinase/integrase [Nitrospirae bacterium]|nr:tyrosine-type recombinase/integrase [Nitrospirota bacterium]